MLPVTTMVCSNCAESLPSVVTAVQLSGQVWSCHTPERRKQNEKYYYEEEHITSRYKIHSDDSKMVKHNVLV